MSKFKIGDQVVRSKHEKSPTWLCFVEEGSPKKDFYTVSLVHEGFHGGYFINLEGAPADCRFSENNFELYGELPPLEKKSEYRDRCDNYPDTVMKLSLWEEGRQVVLSQGNRDLYLDPNDALNLACDVTRMAMYLKRLDRGSSNE